MASATPVPTSTPLSNRLTVANASAVPVTTITAGLFWLGTALVMVGATVLESMTMLAGWLVGLVLPAASVASAVMLWLPSGNTGVVNDHLPVSSATTVPTRLPLS